MTDLDKPTFDNMPNPNAALLPTGKRIRPIETYKPEQARPLSGVLKDLRERELPPNIQEITMGKGLSTGNKEEIFQVCLSLTINEYHAVTEFLAEWRSRYNAQPDNRD